MENEFNQLYVNLRILYTMYLIMREDAINKIRSLGYHFFKISDEVK